jgi:hypothetical protein
VIERGAAVVVDVTDGQIVATRLRYFFKPQSGVARAE